MKSIKLKLVILYIVLVFIVMVVSGTFMIMRERNLEIEKAQAELSTFAREIEEQIIDVYSPLEFQNAFVELHANSTSTTRMEGYILNKNGQVIAPSGSLNETFYDSAIISAYTGKEEYTITKDYDDGKTYLTYAMPVFDESGNIEYVVYTRTDYATIGNTLEQIAQTVVLMSIIALLLTAFLGLLFANTLTVPIAKLSRAMKNYTDTGDLVQLESHSNDEIGQLTRSFNDMAETITKHVTEVVNEKSKNETLLTNMTDGVIAFDRDLKLIHANHVTYDMLPEELVIDFYSLLDVFNVEYDIVDGFHKDSIDSLIFDTPVYEIAQINERYIAINMSTYNDQYDNKSGIIMVTQDVTKHKLLENMRRDFVANVSHELRTPIATIKSYLETIIDAEESNDMEQDTKEEFYNIILHEADRMTSLVQDLLEISKFDNNQFNLNLDVVDLQGMLRSTIKNHEVHAKKKNQILQFEDLEEACFVEVDEKRMIQVFTNIITNAIKYSLENTTIKIRIEVSERHYYVKFKDQGIGIEKDDLARIFERFYRVDKARSRDLGGTGLGLAISKQIVEAHGAKIRASSKINVGTTMTIRLKKYNVEDFL